MRLGTTTELKGESQSLFFLLNRQDQDRDQDLDRDSLP